MITQEFVTEFMLQNFEKVTISRGGMHFHCRCALCGDSRKSVNKKRFHLDCNGPDNIKWHCFNCGKGSRNFVSLYSEIMGLSHKESYKICNRYDTKGIKDTLNRKTKVVKRVIENITTFNSILNDCIGVNDKPKGFVDSKLQKELLKFIKERKISDDIKIFAAFNGKYRNRIIIPIYKGRDIIYFQARRISQDIDTKYLNPVSEKTTIVLNEKLFDYNKYIIITEGILDAYSIGNQGTTCIGKSISDGFIEKLSLLTNKGIIVSLDNDKDGLIELKKILNSKHNKKLKYFLMPYKKIKDLNELYCSESINISNIYDFVVENSYDTLKTKVKLNFDSWR